MCISDTCKSKVLVIFDAVFCHCLNKVPFYFSCVNAVLHCLHAVMTMILVTHPTSLYIRYPHQGIANVQVHVCLIHLTCRGKMELFS